MSLISPEEQQRMDRSRHSPPTASERVAERNEK